MAKKYDDFDEQDSDGMFDQVLGIIANRKREFAIVSVSAAVILLGLVVWGSYPDDADIAATESVPIVRADAGDYKTAPDNPGGMEIPYRDSTVFSANTDGGTENILADESAEEPLPRSQLFAGLNTEGDQPGGAPAANNPAAVGNAPADAPKGEVEETVAANAGKVAPVEPPSNDALVKEAIGVPAAETETAAKPAPVTAPATEPVMDLSSETATAPAAQSPKAETPKAETPKAETAAKSDGVKAAKVEPAAGAATSAAKGVQPGGYYIQLASVRSVDGAAGEYKKIQAKFTALSGVKYRTQEANLGAKGTFHRIQAGPMSKDSATSICKQMKSSGGSCLVTAK